MTLLGTAGGGEGGGDGGEASAAHHQRIEVEVHPCRWCLNRNSKFVDGFLVDGGGDCHVKAVGSAGLGDWHGGAKHNFFSRGQVYVVVFRR